MKRTSPQNDKKLTKTPKGQGRVEGNWEVLTYLFVLIMQKKKWWLLPLLILLAFLSVFVNLSGSHSILPAIYALF